MGREDAMVVHPGINSPLISKDFDFHPHIVHKLLLLKCPFWQTFLVACSWIFLWHKKWKHSPECTGFVARSFFSMLRGLTGTLENQRMTRGIQVKNFRKFDLNIFITEKKHVNM